MQEYLVMIALGFIVGSIPFGVLIALRCGVDPRKVGSFGTGASNTARAVGEKHGKKAGLTAFVLTTALDALKGASPLLLTDAHNLVLVGGFAAVLGHCFSPWLKFKGGKGVATTLGVIIVTQPPVVSCTAVGTFFVVLAFWGYISAASMIATATLPIAVLATTANNLDAVCFIVLVNVVAVMHRENIKRLRGGTERRLRFHLLGRK